MKISLLVIKYYFLVITLSLLVGSISILAKSPPGLWSLFIGIFVLFGLIYNQVKELNGEITNSQIVSIGVYISIPYILMLFFAPNYFGGEGFAPLMKLGGSIFTVIFLIALVHTLVNLSKRILADKPIDDDYEK